MKVLLRNKSEKKINLHVPKLLLQNPIDVKVLRSDGTAHFDQNVYVAGNNGPWVKPMTIRKRRAR